MSVTFIYGGNSRALAKAVGQVASSVLPTIRSVMGVPSGANPEIDGVGIADDYVFVDGDKLVFYKASGDKGC